MGYRVLKVTPAMAEKFLALNTHNRGVRAKHVDWLAYMMLKGEWHRTGEPLRFYKKYSSKDAVLMDGQHRLLAVVQANKTIEFEVIDELPGDSFQYMDQGRPRSAADVLHIEGYKNTNILGGIARTCYIYSVNGIEACCRVMGRGGGARKASNQEILAFVNEHAKTLEAAQKATISHMAHISKQYSILGGCYWIFHKKAAQDTERFFTGLGEGAGLGKTSPVLHMRNVWLAQVATRKKGYRANDLFIMMIQAWNLFRDKRQVLSREVTTIDMENLPSGVR